jgi:hypothetical protein
VFFVILLFPFSCRDHCNLLLPFNCRDCCNLLFPLLIKFLCMARHLCYIGQFEGFNFPTSGSLYFAFLFSFIACTHPLCLFFGGDFVQFLTLCLVKNLWFLCACSQQPTYYNMYCSQHTPKLTPFVAYKCIHEKLQVAFCLEKNQKLSTNHSSDL